MTPAERLIAAADLLEKRAEEATGGPWRANAWQTVSGERRAEVEGDPREGNFRTADGKGWTEVCRGDADGAGPGPFLMEGDATYIATMNPEVGKGLAELLRSIARDPAPHKWDRARLAQATALADLLLAGIS